VIISNRLRYGDQTRGTRFAQFGEEVAKFVLEKVFKHAAVGDKDGPGRGIRPQPAEEVSRVEMEPRGIPVPFPALFDFTFVKIDAVECCDPRQFAGEPFEDATISGADFDKAYRTLAEPMKEVSEMSGDDGMVTEEEILEAMGEPVVELDRGGRGPVVGEIAPQGLVVPSFHRIEKMGVSNEFSRRPPFGIEGFFINLLREGGAKDLEEISDHRLDASVEG